MTSPTSPTTSTSPAEPLWVAVDLFPESSRVLVASSREVALEAIRADIPATEWEAFQSSLARNDEPGADLPLDGPLNEVIAHYYGQFEPDETEEGAFWVGESWLVRPVVVLREAPGNA